MVCLPTYKTKLPKHKGHTIGDIYLYDVEYFEWLIEYIPKLEINVDNFYKLGRPKKHKATGTSFNSIPIAKANSNDMIEMDYKFPDKILKILSAKKNGVYIPPEWQLSKSTTITIRADDLINKGEKYNINKFQGGDEVLKRGTKAPVMIVIGKTKKGDFPDYTIMEDTYTCEWSDNLGRHKKEIKEDDLELS